MEKYYIVKNLDFLDQIKRNKKNERNQKEFIKNFFEKNGICGYAYYLCGTGMCNVAFLDNLKENICLHIEDNQSNNETFGKQLKKSRVKGLKEFRKNSELLKRFQNACVEEEVIINLRDIYPGDWFKETKFGGYRSQIFKWEDNMYLKIVKDAVESITPLYDGFEEIKASEFYIALESLKDSETEI